MKHFILPTWHWSKRLTMIVVIIPVLIFLGFVGAVSLIDFNQYKPQIEQEVSQRTGHELKISGAIEVSVFPFSFSAGAVSLKNPTSIAQRFEREDLLSVKQIRAELSIWSLLVHKQLAIKGLELIEPKLTLLRDEHGYNWQGLAQLASLTPPLKRVLQHVYLTDDWQRHAAVAKAEDLANFKALFKRVNAEPSADMIASVNAAETVSRDESVLNDWHFDSVIIKQGAFEHQDRRVDHTGEVSELNLLAFDVTLGQPFQVRSDFLYNNALNQRDYRFDVSANIDIGQHFLNLEVTNWQGIFNLKLPEEQKVPAMRLVTEGQRFTLDFLNEQVEVDGLKFSALGASFTSSFKGQYGLNPTLSGLMQAHNVDARKWFYHLGLPLPGFVNKQALTSLNGVMNWRLAEDRWSFNDIDAKLDNTAITGHVWQQSKTLVAANSQVQVGEATPSYLFDLSVDRLNLNDYLARVDDNFFTLLKAFGGDEPSEKTTQKGSESKVSRPVSQQTEQEVATYLPIAVPVSMLRTLHAEGQVQVGRFTFDEMVFEKVNLNFNAQQGNIRFAPLNAQLFNGTLASKLELDVNGETPAYRWAGQLEGVSLDGLLQSGWQINALPSPINTNFNLSTQGSNSVLLTHNLKGDLNVKSAKGEWFGVNVQTLLPSQNSVQ